MEKVVLCEPLRSAVGGFGGSLKNYSAVELGTFVVKEVLKNTSVDPREIDDCIMGNILPGSGPNPSRQISVNSGMKVETPAITINRMCGQVFSSNSHMVIIENIPEPVTYHGINKFVFRRTHAVAPSGLV